MNETLGRIVATAATLVVLAVARYVTRYQINRFTRGNRLRRSRGKLANKVMAAFFLGVAAIVIIFVWGLNPRHLWAALAGVLGVIAIGFFAVWSLLSNIVAGVLLFISDPFKIGDVITIVPDNISGTVLELKLFFVVLEDEKGDIIHIPNNFFFQKIVVRPPSNPASDKNDAS
ncbi:MAG: mechanosensitive ion channel domain-containing protein [PVC group bacterium]